MKKYIFIILLLAQVQFPSLVFAQTQLPGYHPERLPNPLEDIGVKVSVSQSSDGYFTYNYAIYNPPINDGRIVRVDIDVQRGEGKAYVRGDGLPRAQRCYVPLLVMSAITQVGMDSPSNWSCGVGTQKMAFWGAHDHPDDILPGQSLSGLVLTSYGLPGIKNIKIFPLIPLSIYPNIEKYDVDMDELRKVQLQDEDRLSFKSKTVGPTSPPENFKPIEFIDYIVSLKRDAYYQGWIIQRDEGKDRDRDKYRKNKEEDRGKNEDKETGIMNSLDKKLNHARAELMKGDTKEAIERLKSFTYEVAALYKEGKEIHHSHITSEAFALLYYNAQYLIEKLGGEKR